MTNSNNTWDSLDKAATNAHHDRRNRDRRDPDVQCHIGLVERGVHSSGGSLSHVGEHVRIDVEGKAYISVP